MTGTDSTLQLLGSFKEAHGADPHDFDVDKSVHGMTSQGGSI